MPKQVSKSSLAAKYGTKAQQAFEAHKNDETVYGAGAELPSGIEAGIAQLTECKFDLYKEGDMKGEYFFLAAGIVKEPKEVDGIPIEGLRTQIGPEPMCDTPNRSRKTMDDHFQWVLNELRKLGVNTKEVDLDNLEATCAGLKEAAPHFMFRTWKGGKQELVHEGGKWKVGNKTYASEALAKQANPYVGQEPRVQHQWRGVKEYQGESVDEVVDNTTEAAPEPKAKSQGTPPKTPPKTATAAPSGDDPNKLAVKADKGDEKAAIALAEIAREAGIDEDTIGNTANWAEVAKLIFDARGETVEESSGEEGGEEVDYATLGEQADGGDQESVDVLDAAGREAGLDPDEYGTWAELAAALAEGGESGEAESNGVPAKGDIVLWKPPTAKKPMECEVMLVFEDKGTCNLKCLDDSKSYKGIKLADVTAQA